MKMNAEMVGIGVGNLPALALTASGWEGVSVSVLIFDLIEAQNFADKIAAEVERMRATIRQRSAS